MDFRQHFGQHALVIGASTTIGEQFARQLAARGMNVILVARRKELLERIAGEIRVAHGVEARVIAMDIGTGDAVEHLGEAMSDVEVGLLVVNANLHKVNLFHRMDRRTKLQMLRMNAEVPMLLTDRFGALMVERKKGGIVFVNVLNSLSPIDIDGVFQATKAFLRVFAECLWLEYRRYGVQVSTVLVNGIEGSESYENKLSPTSRFVAKLIGANPMLVGGSDDEAASTNRDDLLVVDGPLRGKAHLARALGYVKTHSVQYLPSGLNNVVAELGTGERTPILAIGSGWDRYSWYLRLPCLPAGPWAGIVRLEAAIDLNLAEVIAMASVTQNLLGRFASVEYKDGRAPQNLVPIAGLEKDLSHRLGLAPLLYRDLRAAAQSPQVQI